MAFHEFKGLILGERLQRATGCSIETTPGQIVHHRGVYFDRSHTRPPQSGWSHWKRGGLLNKWLIGLSICHGYQLVRTICSVGRVLTVHDVSQSPSHTSACYSQEWVTLRPFVLMINRWRSKAALQCFINRAISARCWLMMVEITVGQLLGKQKLLKKDSFAGLATLWNVPRVVVTRKRNLLLSGRYFKRAVS